jgi:hypothetical protein
MPNQGIDVGDAVFTFLANTTQLDTAMTRVDAIPSRLSPATSAVEGLGSAITETGEEFDATASNIENAGETIVDTNKKVASSYREARGEAMLLGEATGIHLPRHVTSFLATLGPVQGVLSAAFTATAVLFLVEALIKGTEKLTEFIDNTFIYTQAMKDADDFTKAYNAEVIKHVDTMKKLNEIYIETGMSAEQKLMRGIDLSTKSIKEQEAALDELKKHASDAAGEETGLWNGTKNALRGLTDNLLGTTLVFDHMAERNKKAQEDIALEIKKTDNAVIEEKKRRATKEKEEDDEVVAYEKKAADELRKIQFARFEEHQQQLIQAAADEKAFADVLKNMWGEDTAGMAKGMDQVNLFIKAAMPVKPVLLAGADAAHKFGITIQSDLIGQLNEMKKAFDEMSASGLVAKKDLDAFAAQIKSQQAAVDAFGKDNQKAASDFAKAWQQGGQDSEAAIWGFSDAYAKGITAVIKGEEGFGQAMEKATGQFIEQIGQRALVQGMFYLAQGIADTFWAPEKAAADFTASGMFLALGGAATAAGAALTGAAGSGSPAGSGGSTGARGGSVQTTGSGAASGPATSTRMMAGGGLVTGPTLAMIGEKPGTQEAVIPLNDDVAMDRIGKSIGEKSPAGGSGHTFHVHVAGMVSPDNLTKVMSQMSKRVSKGTASLHSSNTMRVTKRSQ